MEEKNVGLSPECLNEFINVLRHFSWMGEIKPAGISVSIITREGTNTGVNLQEICSRSIPKPVEFQGKKLRNYGELICTLLGMEESDDFFKSSGEKDPFLSNLGKMLTNELVEVCVRGSEGDICLTLAATVKGIFATLKQNLRTPPQRGLEQATGRLFLPYYQEN